MIFVIIWRLAASSTIISPFLNASNEGVLLLPFGFSKMIGLLFSKTTTAEFVAPKSIPKIISFCVLIY